VSRIDNGKHTIMQCWDRKQDLCGQNHKFNLFKRTHISEKDKKSKDQFIIIYRN